MGNDRSILVIGTSTGGLAALKRLLGSLPPSFPIPILVTMHVGETSILPDLLDATTPFNVRHASEGEHLRAGSVLVAPPGSHLLVAGDRVQLGKGAKENYSRPAIDPMFRSAAYSFRERCIGILLTGHLDDGSVGLQAIKWCGGITIVQDPEEAEAPEMPGNALRYVEVDHALELGAMGPILVDIANSGANRPRPPMPAGLSVECDLDLHPQHSTTEALDSIAPRSALICPECQGVLWEMQHSPLRYRCHTGHAFTARNFANSQDRTIEEALWSAIRAVRDKEQFFARQQEHAIKLGKIEDAREYATAADQARQNAHVLIQLSTEKRQ